MSSRVVLHEAAAPTLNGQQSKQGPPAPHSITVPASELDPEFLKQLLLYLDATLVFPRKSPQLSIPEVAEFEENSTRPKERMKTMCVALVLCLNIGVDPPDVIKVSPCARMECWIDPTKMVSQKALTKIGAELQRQYERWQPKARYKPCLDPNMEDLKKLCTSLRRNAKDDRVLFHYNGHGVPRPTSNGEIWVFNKQFTQYMPLSIFELCRWLGGPSLFVYDCSNAGMLIRYFVETYERNEDEFVKQGLTDTFKNTIILAACAANEQLPQAKELPADVFTACLTTPVKMALRWFYLQNGPLLDKDVSLDMFDRIPGQLNDRRTMLGELNWIFTAVTDTIAFNSLPRELFQRLFRSDLLLASLFRNFLLTERVLRAYSCHPQSHPALPPMHSHPMWQAWDLAVHTCLCQLPAVAANIPYEPSGFFAEQLTAFEVWLSFARLQPRPAPPEQLPVLLQVLLSQAHRTRALELLGKFVDLGPWAVGLVLSVGIFPYISKLLQSSTRELRPSLVFLWTKILAVDRTCETDLAKDEQHRYFISVLQDSKDMSAEHRTMAAFILTCFVRHNTQGKELGVQSNLMTTCLDLMADEHIQLRQWLCLCLGGLWENYSNAKWQGVRNNAHETLISLLGDVSSLVRTAAVSALAAFLTSSEEQSDHADFVDTTVTSALIGHVHDAAVIVRKEVAASLGRAVARFEEGLLRVINEDPHIVSEMAADLSGSRRAQPWLIVPPVEGGMRRVSSMPSLGAANIFVRILSALRSLAGDPYPEVAEMASRLVDYLLRKATNAAAGPVGSPQEKPRHYAPKRPLFGTRPELTRPRDDLSAQSVPIVSTHFVEQCCQQYAQPRTLDRDQDEKQAADWRSAKVTRTIDQAMRQRPREEQIRFDELLFTDKLAIKTFAVKFHPFEPLLFFAGANEIAILNYETNERFSIGCPDTRWQTPRSSARITALSLLNAHSSALLLTGSSDGVVRIWRDCTERAEMVTAWRAFTELASDDGLVLEWDQRKTPGTLFTAGSARTIRIWDVQHERLADEMSTGEDSACTCLAVDWSTDGHVFAAGFGDGSLYLFDRRQRKATQALRGHKSLLVNTFFHDWEGGEGPRILSGCREGSVRLWDTRVAADSYMRFEVRSRITAMELHPLLGRGVVACGLVNNSVNVYSVFGDLYHSIKHHEGFRGERIGIPIALAFHPFFARLAFGCDDQITTAYTCARKKP